MDVPAPQREGTLDQVRTAKRPGETELLLAELGAREGGVVEEIP